MARYRREYRDEYDYVTDRASGKQGGNGISFTAWLLDALHPDPDLTPDLEHQTFARLAIDVVHWDHPGLLMRTPDNRFGQQAHDDVYAWGLMCVLLELRYLAREWIDYGRGNHPIRWTFNNVRPGRFTWKAWMGRYPHLICHMKLAAQMNRMDDPRIYPLERFVWKIAQKHALRDIRMGRNIEAATHGYARARVAEMSFDPKFQKLGIEWLETFYRRHPEGLGDILGAWGTHWRDHPIVVQYKATPSRYPKGESA